MIQKIVEWATGLYIGGPILLFLFCSAFDINIWDKKS